MPPVAHADDDALHLIKLAVLAGEPSAIYVVDHDGLYLGAVTSAGLARRVFEYLNPSLYVIRHERATTGLLHLGEDVSGLAAATLVDAKPQPLRGRETVAAAVTALHQAGGTELPVVNDAGQLLGVIRAFDILREWAEDWRRIRLGDETGSFY
jgi:CBS domain-containing protein